MSNFQKVALINILAGNEVTPSDWDALERQLKLIESEVKELREAVEKRDSIAVRAETADVLFTAYGLSHRIGADGDADLRAIVNSNISKIDLTLDDAEKTREKYLDVGVFTKTRTAALYAVDPNGLLESSAETAYVTISAIDQIGNDRKSYPAGKWLKSHRFQEPDLPSLSATQSVAKEPPAYEHWWDIGDLTEPGA